MVPPPNPADAFAGPAAVPASPAAAPTPTHEAFTLLDGTATAKAIRAELKKEVAELRQRHATTPGLGVVLVGSRPDSASYVRTKTKVANEIGVHVVDIKLDEDASQDEVLAAVESLNADGAVHGILVQLPLPKHVDERVVLEAIAVDKDADGFAASNFGRLFGKGRRPVALPCTPAGCLELLRRYGVPIAGKHAVVLGRSNIVGTPVAALLQDADATVTVCHSKTPDVRSFVQRADILVAAVGKPKYVKQDWLKPGVVVVDVGINSIDDPSAKRGYRLVGDVDFDAGKAVASYITPVPGGVGPMTIAMLMDNVCNLTRHSLGLPPRGPLGAAAAEPPAKEEVHDSASSSSPETTTTTDAGGGGGAAVQDAAANDSGPK